MPKSGKLVSNITMKSNNTQSQGFTLMELMVVMVLMAILVAAGVSSFLSSQKKGRDSRRKSDLKHITTALLTYLNDKGKFPNDNGLGGIAGCTPDDATLCAWGGEFTDMNGTIYMLKLPEDPSSGKQYYYDVCCSNLKYQLYARLENAEDGDLVRDESDRVLYYDGTDCGGGALCNYAVTSGNRAPDEGHTLVTE